MTSQYEDRRAELRSMLDELLACWDEIAPLPPDSREYRKAKTSINGLEARVLTRARPRRWRFRDLGTAGIRDLSAPGVVLTEGELRYGESVWRANWSYAGVRPAEAVDERTLLIGRVLPLSRIPPGKAVGPNPWTKIVRAADLPATLVLVACINVSSRLRAVTRPAARTAVRRRPTL